MFRYFLILLLLASVSCSEQSHKPEQLISENQYISLLVELQLIRSYAENSQTDSTTVDSLTSEVFKRYNVSPEQFQTSHTYYQQFPKEQKRRIEKAIERLKIDQVVDTTQTSDTTFQSQ